MGKFNGFGGGGGAGGGMNMQAMMKQAQKMQEQMLAAQQELEGTVVEGTSGGGMVSIELTGKKVLQSIRINPQVCDPADVEILEDLIKAAFNDAMEKVQEIEDSSPMAQMKGLI